MAKRRSSADADTRKAIIKGRAAVRDSRQMILDSAAAMPLPEHPRVLALMRRSKQAKKQ